MTGTQLKTLIEETYKNHPLVWVIRTNATNGRNFKIKSLPKGFSDLLVLIRGCNSVFVETKSHNEKQRPDQKAFQERVESLGYEYLMIETIEEFQSFLKGKGI
jgi:hypothetical protein